MNRRSRQAVIGTIQLGCDAVGGTAALAQRNHMQVADRVFSALDAVGGVRGTSRIVRSLHHGIAGAVYGSIRGVSTGASEITARVPAAFPARGAELVDDGAGDRPRPELDVAEGVLNGLYGDFLAARGNGLATTMSLRTGGTGLPLARAALQQAYPAATPRVCLFIHGLACTESIWQPGSGHGERVHFGDALAADLGYTPLYVRYNSGLSVADNGRQLAALLTDLFSAYPAPIEELVLVGHSMGGLVARAVVHQGAQEQAPWLPMISTVISLGTPHCGAPLARAATVVSEFLRRIPTPGTQIPADILDLRSRGIRDLDHGRLSDELSAGPDGDLRGDDGAGPRAHTGRATRPCPRSTPLPPGVAGYAVASTVTEDGRHPVGQLAGDLLVRPGSATGRCRADGAQIDFATISLGGLHHFRLTTDPAVYAFIRRTLAAGVGNTRTLAG